MTESGRERRSFRREAPNQRRIELIEATLRVLASEGIEATTVRAISAEAGVTAGLIRHHFKSKDELLLAAYDFHMERLTGMSEAAIEGPTAAARLARFIRQTLTPPVAAPRALQLWAGFLQMVPHDIGMRTIHRRHYEAFRARLEQRIAEALAEAGLPVDADETLRLAIACNAVLDGLWLEASALPDVLDTNDLVAIGLKSVADLLHIDTLPNEAAP